MLQSCLGCIMDPAAFRLFLFSLLLICVVSAPVKKGRDFEIYSFHINSTVTSRYAITVITSRVANRLNQSQEVHFEVKLPKNAFISKFRMTIEGKTYDGVVKKKEEAQQQYSEATSRGESAGLVSSVGRTLEEFKTSVTVAAYSKVTFELSYEELLKRRLGKYKLLINAQPMQPVADFKIDVYINEHPGISSLDVNGGFNTQELKSAITKTMTVKEAWVNFYPTREQQVKCCGEIGLNGDLTITYEVNRPTSRGELKTSNGYFVHHFAPQNIQRLPKNVVFIIDRSGSMYGRKIEQTRLALLKILGDLSEDDYFGLIIFDSFIDVWKPELLPATERNLDLAKAYVREIKDRGATDINAAVLRGVDMIKRYPREGSASILILLTDGDPTAGEIDTTKIQNNVKTAIGGKFPLYCLGFGFDVNFDFLEKMALENQGVARRIYEDSDADLQLQGFYEEVATPLLTDVQMNYIGAANVTQTAFSQYYNGSEIVVAGQITDNSLETFTAEVIAVSKNKIVTYKNSTEDVMIVLPQHENFIQRVWAYLTVKQLLEKEMTLQGEEKEAARKRALDLSLTYNFVTPLTSMVVTKPLQEETQVAHKPKEGESSPRRGLSIPHGLGPHMYAVPAVNNVLSTQAGPQLPGYLHHPGLQPLPGQAAGGQGQGYSQVQQFKTGQAAATGFIPGLPGLPGLSGHPGHPGQQYPPGQPLVPVRSYLPSQPFAPGRSAVRATQGAILPSFTFATMRPPPPGNNVRFLISAQPDPICFDVPVHQKLRLLLNPSWDFSMNGELSGKGFQNVVLNYKTGKLFISPTTSTYTDRNSGVVFVWGQQEPSKHETENVSIFLRDSELDVTMGSVRVVITLHKTGGETFLWPAVRQQPKNAGTQGILAETDLQYQELAASKLKIRDQEVQATRSFAIDYQISSTPSVNCWLVPFGSAMQHELSDYTIPQL